jgi:uncharacterized protein YcbX
MYVQELWRYPVKSMAGERVGEAELTQSGFAGDRRVVVVGANGRVVTSRTRHQLLGLRGTTGQDGLPVVSGHPWNSPEALRLVKEAAGADAKLVLSDGLRRFDILPLLVATDGAIAHMGFDGRRLRPNIVIGGVEGLAERTWPGKRLLIGNTVVAPAQLRARCVMTTYDPDTLRHDGNVLKSIVNELDGTMALDTSVVEGGLIREGDEVTLVD